ncbi:MAG: spore coat protein [Clostridiaceae bacterium]|nr:spore coat protein [Clostridiaceae bacterium]
MSEIYNRSAQGHLKLISEFHREARGYKYPINKDIKNNLGKTIEEYKVEIKKTQKYLQNHIELLTPEAEGFLKRAENSIKVAENSNYIELIKRSMSRGEICIGSNIPLNIGDTNEIMVINIEDCAYDMIEMDGVYYLSKLKRKEVALDFNKLIKIYCEDEGLGIDSENFMLALLSYPVEFFKCFEKYRLNKKLWGEDEFIKKIEKALKKDGNSLI